MPYDNEYNREIARQINERDQQYINHQTHQTGGFLPFLPMIASALLPSAISGISNLIRGRGRRHDGMMPYKNCSCSGGSRLGRPSGNAINGNLSNGGGRSGGAGATLNVPPNIPSNTNLLENSSGATARRMALELNGAGRSGGAVLNKGGRPRLSKAKKLENKKIEKCLMPKRNKMSGGVGALRSPRTIGGAMETPITLPSTVALSRIRSPTNYQKAVRHNVYKSEAPKSRLLFKQEMQGVQQGSGRSGGATINKGGRPRLSKAKKMKLKSVEQCLTSGKGRSGGGRSGGASRWIDFVKEYRSQNPHLSYKEAMMEAKKHY